MKIGAVLAPPALCLRGRHLAAMLAGLLGALLVPLLMRTFGMQRAAQTMAAVLLANWLLVLWCLFVSGLLRQNEPALARLVPRQAQRLRWALVVGWGVAALSMAALGRGVFGLGLAWLLLGALALLTFAWMTRWPQLWSVLWVLPAFSWLWLQWVPLQALGRQLRAFANAQPLPATLATLALAMLVLPALVRQGGDAHRRSHERRERRRRAARLVGEGAGGWRLPGWSAGLRRLLSTPYRAWLGHLCGARRASVMARAMLVLGPSAHWTGQATAALIIAGLTVAVLLVQVALQVLPSPNFSRVYLAGPAFGLMMFSINPLLQARTAMFRSRREQALLMLLPGVPRGAGLSRALARRLMAHFLVSWAAAGSVALLLMHGVPGAGAAVQATVFACLPCGLLVWCDWSRLRAPGGIAVAATVLLVVLACALAVALQRGLGVSLAALTPGSLGLTLALGAWRWRVLGRVATPWPAGRSARR